MYFGRFFIYGRASFSSETLRFPYVTAARGGGRELALFAENFGFDENFVIIVENFGFLYVLNYMVGTCYPVPGILNLENFGPRRNFWSFTFYSTF